MVFLLGIAGSILIGLIVFGGGQVFMPLFKSLWELMSTLGIDISADDIENVFTVANATPGVVSTQLATFTGYFLGNGMWYGWVLMILTYLVFVIPSIFLVVLAYKAISKTESSQKLKNVIIFLRPVVVGIIFTLIIQLLVGVALPFINFNTIGDYASISWTTKEFIFLEGWRMVALIPFIIVVIFETMYLYGRKKMNLGLLILLNIAFAMIVFQPWLF